MKRILSIICYMLIAIAGFAQSAVVEVKDTISGCDQHTWRGQDYTSSGDYADTVWTTDDPAVIDTIYQLNLTIHQSSSAILPMTSCDSYPWYGDTYTESTTTPTHILQNVAGCDSVVTLHLTINRSNTGIQTETHCDSFTWHDSTYTASTVSPTYTEQNVAGCDSVVNLHLIIKHRSEYVDNQEQCDTYRWIDGVEYTSSTSSPYVVLSTPNAVGCDSIVRLNLTMHQKTYATYADTACDSYTWINGQAYMSSTDAPQIVLRNQYGCDSIVSLNLFVKNSSTGILIDTACDSYEWHGITYTMSTDMPTYTERNVAGCDSVVTLNLTINRSNAGVQTETYCDSYTWHDSTYTVSTNSPTYTEQNVAGCDSVVTLHLTINRSNTGTQTETYCDSYTWHDSTYTASTSTQMYTEQNMAGCDSVVTLHLTINRSNTGTQTETHCDSYTWHDSTYTASTSTPIYTERNVSGCDSVVTLNLTINPSTAGIDVQRHCDSYTWRDSVEYFASTPTPVDTIPNGNVFGCDSVVTLHLAINPSTAGIDVQRHCDRYTWRNSVEYFASTTTPVDTIPNGNVFGCDSVVTLHLTINPSTAGIDVQRHCDRYTWINGVEYIVSTTTPVDTIPNGNVFGCDSVVTLNLTIQQNIIVQKWNDVLIVNKNQIDSSLNGNECKWYLVSEAEDVFLGTGLYHRATESGDYMVSVGDSIWSCPKTIVLPQQKAVIASPNPVVNRTVVTGGDWQIGDRVTVLNMYGQPLAEGVVNNQTYVEIDMTPLPKGVYMVQVANDIVKVVKQ